MLNTWFDYSQFINFNYIWTVYLFTCCYFLFVALMFSNICNIFCFVTIFCLACQFMCINLCSKMSFCTSCFTCWPNNIIYFVYFCAKRKLFNCVFALLLYFCFIYVVTCLWCLLLLVTCFVTCSIFWLTNLK